MLVSIFGGFASLLTIGASTSQTVTATPTKMTGWSSNGISSGLTPDHTSDDVLIDVDGVYRINWGACFSGTNSKTYFIAIYKDVGAGFIDAGLPRIERKLGTGGDVGSSHMHGNISLSATDKVAAYVWSSDGGTSFVPQEASLSINRIS